MIKEVIRTCVVSRNKLSKYDLFRIVKTKNNKILLDFDYKIQGRGVYLSKNIDIINKAIKSKLLNRCFKTNVDDDIYIQLLNKIGEKNEN